MRLIAEGLAARGHQVTFASLRPDALPFARRFARERGRGAALPEPAPVAAARGSLRRLGLGGAAAPGARRRAWARVGRAAARAGGAEGRRPLCLLRDGVPRRGAPRAGGGAPGMAIVMRMAGLGWHEALVRDGGDPAESMPPSSTRSTRSTTSRRASRALVEARAAELGHAARAARELRRRHRRRRRPGAARLGAGRAPGPGSTSWSRPASPPPQKRQDLLIEALGLLRDRLPVRVTMIGDGATRAASVAPARRARARRTRSRSARSCRRTELWATHAPAPTCSAIPATTRGSARSSSRR